MLADRYRVVTLTVGQVVRSTSYLKTVIKGVDGEVTAKLLDCLRTCSMVTSAPTMSTCKKALSGRPRLSGQVILDNCITFWEPVGFTHCSEKTSEFWNKRRTVARVP
jgi:hypothetical protein